MPFVLRTLAALAAETGDLDEAEPMVRKAVQLSESQEDQINVVEALRAWGEVKMRQGDEAQADDHLRRSWELARQVRYPYGEARALYEHGPIHACTGEQLQARERLVEAHTIFQRLGATLNAARAKEMLATVRGD